VTVSLRVCGALLISAAVVSLTTSDALTQERETVLDRVVHVEDGIREIPETPRLESGLDVSERRIDVGGAELYVEEEGTGVPLVLINGGPGGTHHYFHPWFSRAAEFARIIYYDQRGTGLSDFEPGEAGYSVEQAVADLDAMRIALGIEKWVLLGYSYGGFLAQYYTTMHPEHVAGLVLVGASPGLWVDLGHSRQRDYLSDLEAGRMRAAREELRARRADEGWSRGEYLQLLIYNNFLNGDWKRQHFYKPTPEQFAHIALYEWVNDANFNSIMNQSAQKVDLAGAFDNNPIPTLLLEGKWDLTWGDGKPTILSRNHPRARMVVIERAGHPVFSEHPDAFFGELEHLIRNVRPVTSSEIEAYRRHLGAWRAAWHSSPRYLLRAAGVGTSGSQQIAEAYSRDWLEAMRWTPELLRIGFALYDTEQYEEALGAFVRVEEVGVMEGREDDQATALVWQGHLLDLLERRDEAIARYQRVVDMDLSGGARHDQYGLVYSYSPYAAERLQTPFDRIENAQP
jgi:proline-specific peptidase